MNNKSVNYYSTAALNTVKNDLCHGPRGPRGGKRSDRSLSLPVCPAGRPDSVLSDSEDENPEALQPLRPPRPLGHYSLCEQGQPDSLLLATPPPSPREVERSAVVINQPAPLSSPRQANADTLTHSSDSVRHAI